MYLSELYSELYKFEGKYHNFCFYNFRNSFEKRKVKTILFNRDVERIFSVWCIKKIFLHFFQFFKNQFLRRKRKENYFIQGRWKNIFNLSDAACKKSILTLLVLIFFNFSKINSLEKRKENDIPKFLNFHRSWPFNRSIYPKRYYSLVVQNLK